MEEDNEACNTNQCVNECPDKYIKGDNNFCKQCIILQIYFINLRL